MRFGNVHMANKQHLIDMKTGNCVWEYMMKEQIKHIKHEHSIQMSHNYKYRTALLTTVPNERQKPN